MNKGAFQNSSPVQPMMAGGNPNWWWNVNGICSPPSLPLSAPPIPLVATAPSNLFPDQLYAPTASGVSSSSKSSSCSSWQDINNPSESWSQLLFACRGGLVGEDHGSGNRVSHFQDQQKSPDGPSASNHVKLENSTSCSCDMYGYLNDQQDFQLGSIAKPSMWSPVAPVASSAGSCTTSIETNNVLDLSKNRPGTRHPPRNRANECDSIANGGPQKKAKVEPPPTCKAVRKEKLGDRITALHQLVSPFGKTDTASVLSEAIGYIRFLHSQIQALSSPYLGGRVSVNPRQPINIEKEAEKGEDLRSRGLCLVPVSCTVGLGSENCIRIDSGAAATSFGSGGIGFR